jgi:hypothetical protein
LVAAQNFPALSSAEYAVIAAELMRGRRLERLRFIDPWRHSAIQSKSRNFRHQP